MLTKSSRMHLAPHAEVDLDGKEKAERHPSCHCSGEPQPTVLHGIKVLYSAMRILESSRYASSCDEMAEKRARIPFGRVETLPNYRCRSRSAQRAAPKYPPRSGTRPEPPSHES